MIIPHNNSSVSTTSRGNEWRQYNTHKKWQYSATHGNVISQENVNIQPFALQYLYVKTVDQQLAYETTFSYSISDT
jgi:hypothetical protein